VNVIVSKEMNKECERELGILYGLSILVGNDQILKLCDDILFSHDECLNNKECSCSICRYSKMASRKLNNKR